MPACWADSQFDATRKFLASLNYGKQPIIAQLIGLIVHILSCGLFIFYLKFGVIGVALATNASSFTSMIVLDNLVAHNLQF